ncbi:hypothetical protein [Paenibacillus sp. NEAU-GSW1]|uniref:hypothetical protein n=1 Tax=Paenibacillus sp. NEAU-GSW1 TaxID=2682486 RepID=UPI0012E31082|nr:hypothetical protein [Paenibacillus sp. NEAU-GSW1]MUT68352.1 hypothetical protein [Paenibacillus sp. NEAU-GSW1]
MAGIYRYIACNSENVVQIHDDMFGYIQDSLNWIETLNPDKQNESMLGFNYYGRSIIEKNGAEKFIKIIKAWYLMFKEAPDDLILTGRYVWSEVLNLLNRLIDFSKMVETGAYLLIYIGI